MILSGNNVIAEQNIDKKFVFLLNQYGVFRMDTSKPGGWFTEYAELEQLVSSKLLDPGHYKLIKDRVAFKNRS